MRIRVQKLGGSEVQRLDFSKVYDLST